MYMCGLWALRPPITHSVIFDIKIYIFDRKNIKRINIDKMLFILFDFTT